MAGQGNLIAQRLDSCHGTGGRGSFADRLDLDPLRRLVRSIYRFLEPSEATQIQQQLDISPFEFLGSSSPIPNYGQFAQGVVYLI